MFVIFISHQWLLNLVYHHLDLEIMENQIEQQKENTMGPTILKYRIYIYISIYGCIGILPPVRYSQVENIEYETDSWKLVFVWAYGISALADSQ